jgi:hypothetical protein
MNEEIEVTSQNNDDVSRTQYEDMKRTIQLLKSQLKENEEKCFLMKQV